MTSAVITGAGGFAGSHVLEAVLSRGWDAVCIDSFRHNGVTDRIASVWNSFESPRRVTLVRHDLGAPLSPMQHGIIGHPDYIFSIASLCQVDQSIEDPRGFITNNVDLILTVAELARDCWPARLIHFSTDEVYGTQVPMSVSDHRPSSPYAASKACQEDILHAYARTFGTPLTIINSANMFGERQSQLAFIPRIIRAALTAEPMQVHMHGGKQPTRRYTYVRNVAEGVVNMLAPINKERVGFPGQREIGNLDLIQLIEQAMGMTVPYELVDGETARPGYDHEYASVHSADDWVPPYTFEQGIERTIRWAYDHQEWLAA